MIITKNKNNVVISSKNKELTILKEDNDTISLDFFNSRIDNNNDKAIEFGEENKLVYDSVRQLFNDLKEEYFNYREYFDQVYKEFIDEYGNVRNISIFNKKHDSFIFYSDNGNFNNNSYIRIFKNNDKYYIYFNKPSMGFTIKEDNSKFKYNSFYKYFLSFMKNIKGEKKNKYYGKLKNFNNSI